MSIHRALITLASEQAWTAATVAAGLTEDAADSCEFAARECAAAEWTKVASMALAIADLLRSAEEDI